MLIPNMAAFEPYVQSLKQLIEDALRDPHSAIYREAGAGVLDGQAGIQLRALVDLTHRKLAGAFFTSSSLRQRAIKGITHSFNENSIIIDPACGAADLLIECAAYLPVCSDLTATIQSWGKQLYGFDSQPQFIQAAKSRLLLRAMDRVTCWNGYRLPKLDEVFPLVQAGDSLESAEAVAKATHIVLNPPYTRFDTPPNCEWSSGKVSAAAVFLDFCLTQATPGARLVAILPDVLRSGSRYAKWRGRVESLAQVEDVDCVGRFDAHTDVDVFILRLIAGLSITKRTVAWTKSSVSVSPQTVDDFFHVSVGPVVPHRDPRIDPPRPFIYARLLSGHRTYNADTADKQSVKGRSVTPPFVVVRRTSRPDTSDRIIATIITGYEPVMVENHLIILKPRVNCLSSCESLMENIDDERTKTWLNERIRCRHLTVTALKALPWWSGER